MTRWWWVRHGPTHEKAMVGWRDVPADLSDLDQIARLRASLPQGALLVSSDLIRARDTALALGSGPPDQSPALREFNFGHWDGLHHTEISARDPDLSRAYWDTPGDLSAPGGESWNAVSARVSTFVAQVTRANLGRDIIAVAHFGVILTQVQQALGVTPYEALAHRIDPLSVTDLTFDAGVWRAGRINHLP